MSHTTKNKEVRVLNDLKNELYVCHNKIYGWLDDKTRKITKEDITNIAIEIVQFILTKKCITREVLNFVLNGEPGLLPDRACLQRLPHSTSSGKKRRSKSQTRLHSREEWTSHIQDHDLQSNTYVVHEEEQKGQKGKHVNLLGNLRDQIKKLEEIVRLREGTVSYWKKKAQEAESNNTSLQTLEESDRLKTALKTTKSDLEEPVKRNKKETDGTFNKLMEENKRLTIEANVAKTKLNELNQKFNSAVYNQVKKQNDENLVLFEEKSERYQAKIRKLEQDFKDAIARYYESLRGESTSVNLRIETLLADNADLNQKCKVKDELLQKATKENQQLKVDIEQFQSHTISVEKEILNTRVQILKEEKSELETRTRSRSPHVTSEPKDCKQCWKYKNDISDLRRDVNSLRDRLSEVAGNKLRDNNPNIADLSDMNRPTSLVEKFGALYTDEYSDAMEVFENKMKHADCVGAMLQWLKISYDWCEKLASEQREMLTNHSIGFMQKYQVQTEAFVISAKCLIHVKEFQKKIAADSLIAVGKICQEQNLKEEKLLNDHQITKYIKKCSELCWMMQISDPPLCLKFDVKRGENLDRNSYNVFTKSGSKVDFLVWPVLYLHKTGPLLAKGVVQGM